MENCNPVPMLNVACLIKIFEYSRLEEVLGFSKGKVYYSFFPTFFLIFSNFTPFSSFITRFLLSKKLLNLIKLKRFMEDLELEKLQIYEKMRIFMHFECNKILYFRSIPQMSRCHVFPSVGKGLFFFYALMQDEVQGRYASS